MYPKYFLILFLAQKKPRGQEFTQNSTRIYFFGQQLLIIVED